MKSELAELARSTKGFMPEDEGLALYEAALAAGQTASPITFVEVGSYCGKSTIYLAAAALELRQSAAAQATAPQACVITIDHHRGSEEMQAGWEHHDPSLIDPATGRFDSLPQLRSTLDALAQITTDSTDISADLSDTVIAVVGNSPTVATHFRTKAQMVFIDGGHGTEPAHVDYESWAPKLASGGTLAIHDVFENPAEGGRPPFEIYARALADGFTQASANGSLRVLLAP